MGQDLKQPPSIDDVKLQKDVLQKKKDELQVLEADYLEAQKLLSEKQRRVDELEPLFDEHYEKIQNLDEYRDDLNAAIRNQRKFIKDTETRLNAVKVGLAENEKEVIEIRKRIAIAKREANPIYKAWDLAQMELKKAEDQFKLALENFQKSQQDFLREKEKQQPSKKNGQQNNTKLKMSDNKNNPWASGTFYLFTFIAIVITLALLASLSLPWYLNILIMIASLFVLLIIGALQLRNDKNLSEKNFITLMVEVIKQFPLLKK